MPALSTAMLRRALLAATILSAAPAMAQEVAPPETDGGKIEEIIVTGQKTAARLSEVTASVSVTTGAEIAREPVTNLYDVLARVPNVTAAFGEQGFAIRGIDQRGVGSAGNGQTLTIYVDDAPLGNFTTFFGPLDAWDLGQVEVYRGPQSTNFGRNALAGAIYVRTRDPSYQPDLRVRAEYGNYGTYQVAAAGGGAIVPDKLAVRFAASQRESDGFIDNILLGSDADPVELKTARAKLLFEPTETVRLIATSSYTENFGGEDGLRASDAFQRKADYNVPGEEGTDTFLNALNATWQVTDGLDLVSITTYQQTDYVRVEDQDRTAADGGFLDRKGEDDAFSQELRVVHRGDRLSGVIGAYYVQQENSFDDELLIAITAVDPRLPLRNLVSRRSVLNDTSTNYAVFTDLEVDLTDRLTLLGGLRYDHEEGDTDATQIVDILGDIPPPFAFLRALEGESTVRTDAAYDAWLPKLGLRFAATEDVILGLVWQRAYRAGGAELNQLDGSISTFAPEYLSNVEASARVTLLEGRLRWNSNAYYGDWTDQQVGIPYENAPTLFRTVNAGKSTIYGFETDLTWVVGDGLELYGAVGYAETEFDDFPNPDGDPDNFAGRAFPFAPEWTFNLGADYEHASGLFGGVDVNFRDSVFSDQENLAANAVDAYTIVNARIGYRLADRYSISLIARNLFDEDYYTILNRDGPNDFARVGAPLTWAVRVDAQF